ncbi:MAG: hypothetical protein ACREUE_00215, partial [Panacagrimonas sp.]
MFMEISRGIAATGNPKRVRSLAHPAQIHPPARTDVHSCVATTEPFATDEESRAGRHDGVNPHPGPENTVAR